MSGDAQPRKRKDKRRRKEDEELFGHFKNPTDEVIHVQKEAGLGGNICTKLIFFLLLGAIGVTVGFILVKYHGSTDDDVYNDAAPWNVAIKQWIEYLPVLPDVLRGETDDHHQHESPGEHSEEEHEEEEEQEEEEEHEEHDDTGGGEVEAGESWLDIGQQWLSELEFDFSFGANSVDKEVEGGEEEEEESGVDAEKEGTEQVEDADDVEEDKSGEEEGDDDEDEDKAGSGKSEELAEEEDEKDEEEKSEEQDVEEKSEEQDVEGKSEELGDDDDDELEKDKDKSVDQEDEGDDEEESENKEDGEDEEEEKEQSEEQDDDNKEEEEDLSLEDLGRELVDEYEEEEDEKEQGEEEEDVSLEDLTKELDEEEDQHEEIEKELREEEDDDDEAETTMFRREEPDQDDGLRREVLVEEAVEEVSALEEEAPVTATESTHEVDEHAAVDRSEEELFPEAIEALKLEASELLRAQAEAAVEKASEQIEEDDEPNQPVDESETDGMALKFGVGVALVVVAHLVLVKKWNSWVEANEPLTEIKSKEESEVTSREVPSFEAVRVPAYTTAPPTPPPSVYEEVVQKVYTAQTSAPATEPTPQPQVVKSEPAEVSEEEEEEEVVEVEGGDDDIDEDIGLSPKRYQELLEKYGQPTPESSDIEQSDEEPPGVREYSDGGEAESVGEEESANELEESEPEEVEEEEETYIKVEKPATAPTAVELESEEEEEEEEEEESEDEPPPPPPPPAAKKPASKTSAPSRDKGGPKDVEEDYPNAEITNAEDWAIKEELDMADEEFNFDRVQSAMDKFTFVLTRQPKSPRALYGVARALDLQAEAKSSNAILDKAIDAYMAVIRAPQVPDELFRRAADRLINRLRFRGQHMKAVPVYGELISRFNTSVKYRNDLAINYLMVNRLEEAGAVFREVLDRWPQDPMARSHYGLVLKLQGKMEESIPHLLAGISTDDLSTRDARLYFHLGDALARTGAKDQAMKIYIDGVEKGMFRSKYQRSLYNVDRLTARPWWTHAQTEYHEFFRKLEENWKQIKEEGLSALKMKGLYQDEAESLRDSGDWKQFELYVRGVKYAANCKQAPVTCSLIDSFPPARTCKRGQTKFSVMSGGTHVWPHCGPTNCRLRAHLGLIVPREKIEIRVAEETRKWEEGKVFIFDDSFEHEVWHNGTAPRLVLIVDVWHPELTLQEIRILSPI